MAEDYHETIARTGEPHFLTAPEAADGECHLCGGPTDSLAGDPGRWPLRFAAPDGTGVCRHWHAGCVMGRMPHSLAGRQAGRDLEADLSRLLSLDGNDWLEWLECEAADGWPYAIREALRLRSAVARALSVIRARPNTPEALRAAAAILEEVYEP